MKSSIKTTSSTRNLRRRVFQPRCENVIQPESPESNEPITKGPSPQERKRQCLTVITDENSCSSENEEVKAVVPVEPLRCNPQQQSLVSKFDYAFKLACTAGGVADHTECLDYVFAILDYELDHENMPMYKVGAFLEPGSSRHPQLTSTDLSRLVDWMDALQQEFALQLETFHLAVGLLYAFLTKASGVTKKELPLMACACLFVASKFEERDAPLVAQLVLCLDPDNRHHRSLVYPMSQRLVNAESRLLTMIGCAVNRPNAYVLLRRYGRVLDLHDTLIQYVARFLLEVTVHSYAIMQFGENRRASVCLLLSRGLVMLTREHEKLENGEARVGPRLWATEFWPDVLRTFTRCPAPQATEEECCDVVELMQLVHCHTLWMLHQWGRYLTLHPSPDRHTVNIDFLAEQVVRWDHGLDARDWGLNRNFLMQHAVSKYASSVFLNSATVYERRLAKHFPRLLNIMCLEWGVLTPIRGKRSPMSGNSSYADENTPDWLPSLKWMSV